MALTNNILFQKIVTSALLKKAGTVFSGTVVAQGLLLGSAPVLSRLYEVHHFGEMGFFMLIGMLGAQLFNWRVDYGIISAKSDLEAQDLIIAGILASLISAIAMIAILVFASNYFSVKAGFNFNKYIPFVVLYSISYALWNSLSFYNIKNTHYKKNALFNVLRSALMVIISIALYKVSGYNGLIIGLFFGQFAATIYLLFSTLPFKGGHFWDRKRFSINIFKKTLNNNKQLIKYSLPAAATELLAGQLPQYFIGSFGTLVFGWFSQANRLINAPLDLVGQSIRSVFWETSSSLYLQNQNTTNLFDRTLAALFLISIVPFTVLFYIAPDLFSWVLGPSWFNAGIYAKILIPMCFFRFLSNPVSSMLFTANRQRWDFYIQVTVLVVVLFIFFLLPIKFKEAKWAIMAYSIIYSTKYITELIVSRKCTLLKS